MSNQQSPNRGCRLQNLFYLTLYRYACQFDIRLNVEFICLFFSLQIKLIINMTCISLQSDKLLSTFTAIMTQNLVTLKITDKLEWWKQREELDDKLKVWKK